MLFLNKHFIYETYVHTFTLLSFVSIHSPFVMIVKKSNFDICSVRFCAGLFSWCSMSCSPGRSDWHFWASLSSLLKQHISANEALSPCRCLVLYTLPLLLARGILPRNTSRPGHQPLLVCSLRQTTSPITNFSSSIWA